MDFSNIGNLIAGVGSILVNMANVFAQVESVALSFSILAGCVCFYKSILLGFSDNSTVQERRQALWLAIAGILLVQITVLFSVILDTISNGEESVDGGEVLRLSEAAQSTDDPMKAGILACLSFLACVGWITGIRGLLAWSSMGTDAGRGQFWAGACGILFGALMVVPIWTLNALTSQYGSQFTAMFGM